MYTSNRWVQNLLWASVIVAALIASRLWIETPNFKPVAAICMWSLLLFSRWTWAVAVPAVGMVLSDFLLGMSPLGIAVPVYGSLAVMVGLGYWARQAILSTENKLWQRLAVLLTLSLCGGLQFFVLTNLGVWAWSGWYPVTWPGLMDCFAQALPFYRWTLASDLWFGFLPVASLLCVRASWVRSARLNLSPVRCERS
jgi:hypothetical protein